MTDLVEFTFAFYKQHGVKRAFMFNSINEDAESNGGLWQNCGLRTSSKSGMKPKMVLDRLKNNLK